MNKRTKNIIYIAFTIAFLILIISLLVMIEPETIVSTLGVNNSYLVLFIFAIFGGVSAFTSASFYATMVAFYQGNLNLFYLALVGAIGLAIGDSFFYYIGLKGHELTRKTSYKKKIEYLQKKIDRIPPKLTSLFIFIYAGMTVFPKDILCLAFGLSRYSYIKFIIPMSMGNLLFNFIVLYVVSLGLS